MTDVRSSRALLRSIGAAGLGLLVVALLAACSGAPGVPVTARSSVRPTVAPAVTSSVPVTSTAAVTSSVAVMTSAGATDGAGTDGAGTDGVQIRYSRASTRDPQGRYTVSALTFHVTGASPVVNRALAAQLNGTVGAAERHFVAGLAGLGKEPTPFTLTVSVTAQNRWGWLYSVRFLDEVDLHGAHPYAEVRTVTVDLRTGRAVTVNDLFASVPRADVPVRKAFAARGYLGGPSTEITLGAPSPSHPVAVSSYPTRPGLLIAASQCAPEPCASGLPVLLVPWRSLPATRQGALPA